MLVLTFQHNKENFCLPIDEVSEVLQDVPVLSMPRVPDPFDGIFQLRGHIITLFNFAKYFGDAGAGESQILVFSDPRNHFSMRVPDPVESLELHSDPKELTGRQTESTPFLQAIVYDGEEIYHLLSASKIFTRAGEMMKEYLLRRAGKETHVKVSAREKEGSFES